MAHVGKELAFGAIGRFCCLASSFEFLVHAGSSFYLGLQIGISFFDLRQHLIETIH